MGHRAGNCTKVCHPSATLSWDSPECPPVPRAAGCGCREQDVPRGHSRALHFPPTEPFRNGRLGHICSTNQRDEGRGQEKAPGHIQILLVFAPAEMWVSALPPDRDSQLISVSVEQSCWPQACRDIFNKIKCRFLFSPSLSTCVIFCFPPQLPGQHAEAAPSPGCSLSVQILLLHTRCALGCDRSSGGVGHGDEQQQHCQDLRAALLEQNLLLLWLLLVSPPRCLNCPSLACATHELLVGLILRQRVAPSL